MTSYFAPLAALWLLACSEAVVRVEYHTPDASAPVACDSAQRCDDGLFCNGAEQCEHGRCVAGEAPRCDDAVACTRDGCQEGQGCVHIVYDVPACRADAGADASLHDGGGQDAQTADEAGMRPPLDLARPPEVPCPSSVQSIQADTESVLAQYGNVTCVAGGVTLGAQLKDLSALSNLRRVGGQLSFAGDPAALRALMQLERVDGNVKLGVLLLADAGVPFGLDVQALRWVGGDLSLSGELAPGALAALAYVGGKLSLTAQPVRTGKLPFEALSYVGGDVVFDGSLPGGLGALQVIGGDVSFTAMQPRALEPLPQLRVIGGSLRVAQTALDVPLALPALERVNAVLSIVANPALPALDLPRLTEVDSFDVRANPLLSRCEVDALHGQLHAAAPGKVCCNLGCERCAGRSCLLPGAITAGQPTYLEGSWDVGEEISPLCVRAVETAQELHFAGDVLEQGQSLALKHADSLIIESSALTDLNMLSGLRSAGTLRIEYNDALRSVHGLESLQLVTKELRISQNAALEDISALDRARGGALMASGTLRIAANPRLDQCQVDAIDAGGAPNRVCHGACNAAVCSPADAGL